MYRINFFGTGMKVWKCHFPHKLFLRIDQDAKDHSETWENLIFDLDYINQLGYKHWTDLHVIQSVSGLIISEKNFIEIRKPKGRVRKIMTQDLVGMLLFPLLKFEQILFITAELEEGIKEVYLVQFTTGLVYSTRVEQDHIILDDLTAMIIEVPGAGVILNGIAHKNVALELKNEDTVVIGSRVIIMK